MIAADWKPWFDVLQWLLTIGIGLSLWLRRPGEDAGKAVGELRAQHAELLQGLAQRLTRIETHIDHMPDEGEFRQLEGQVKKIEQNLQGIRDSLDPIRNTLSRIEDFLLRNRLPGPQ